jgi:hypothetical protein
LIFDLAPTRWLLLPLVVIGVSTQASRAQEKISSEEAALMKYSRIVTIEGPYTYDFDGAPVLGWITARLDNDRVSFLMCSQKTAELEFKLLRKTSGECPKGPRVPTPWYVFQDKLLPTVMTEFKKGWTHYLALNAVRIEGTDVGTLPANFQAVLRTAKPGEAAAMSFISEKGDVVLGIVSTQR